MRKELLRSHKDFNHEIWKSSLVAMTQKVLHFLDHKSHIFPTLGRIAHMCIAVSFYMEASFIPAQFKNASVQLSNESKFPPAPNT